MEANTEIQEEACRNWNEESNFNNFPLELIFAVFSKLDFKELYRAAPVCKLWSKLTHDPFLYKKISLTWDDDINTADAMKLIQGKDLLRELVVVGRHDISEIMHRAAGNCPQLETVVVTDCQISGTVMKCLADHCVRIETLNLDRSHLVHSNITYVSKMKRLKAISFSYTFINNPREILQIVRYCSMLEEIEIDNVRFNVNRVPVFYLPDDAVSSIISIRHETLRKLILDGVNMSEATLKQVSSTCDKLLILGFYSAPHISEIGLRWLFLMDSLVWLNITVSAGISAQIWKNVVRRSRLKNLRHLDISQNEGIEDETLDIIGRKFRFLSFLNISACNKVTDRGIVLMIENCTGLRMLISTHLPSLTGTCFSDFPKKLADLVLLDLDCCSHVNKRLLKKLQACMPQLGVRHHDSKTNRIYDQVVELQKVEECISVKEAIKLYRIREPHTVTVPCRGLEHRGPYEFPSRRPV